MEVDIYIKETNGSRELRIPWLPDTVKFTRNGTRMAKYEILDVGSVHVPTGSELGKFSWESYFPGEGHKDLPFLRGTWQDPKKIQTMLSEWSEYGTPLRIIMTGTPINHDVYLTDYNVNYESGYGDYKYDIEFERRRDIKIVATKMSGSSAGTASAARTYTVKSGDTLWAIAKKFLGSGTKHGTIYQLNKAIIEQTAKKHGKSSSSGGHWIYPGTILQIPGAGTVTSSAKGKTTGQTGTTGGSGGKISNTVNQLK